MAYEIIKSKRGTYKLRPRYQEEINTLKKKTVLQTTINISRRLVNRRVALGTVEENIDKFLKIGCEVPTWRKYEICTSDGNWGSADSLEYYKPAYSPGSKMPGFESTLGKCNYPRARYVYTDDVEIEETCV